MVRRSKSTDLGKRFVISDANYPVLLVRRLGAAAPPFMDAIGDLDLPKHHKVALFCSRRCPAEKIIEAQDLARRLRDDGVTVISGFHSPVEKECLRVLLKGMQPIIICTARGLEGMRRPQDWRHALKMQRILILSSLPAAVRRLSVGSTEIRNRFVSLIADETIFVHTSSGSKLTQLKGKSMTI